MKGCLDGIKILTTGVYETIEREDLLDLLNRCGAKCYAGMSRYLNYLLVGRDAGPVKLQNADEWGITQLSEEEFFQFITEKINNYDPEQAAQQKATLDALDREMKMKARMTSKVSEGKKKKESAALKGDKSKGKRVVIPEKTSTKKKNIVVKIEIVVKKQKVATNCVPKAKASAVKKEKKAVVVKKEKATVADRTEPSVSKKKTIVVKKEPGSESVRVTRSRVSMR